MKRYSLPIVACVAALLIGALAYAAEAPAKKAAAAAKPAKAPTAKYLVISPHTPEECVKALDSMEAAKVLEKFDFGCNAGDHTGYAIVNAASEEEALSMVPADLREKARAVKLNKYTPAQLKEIHEKMKS